MKNRATGPFASCGERQGGPMTRALRAACVIVGFVGSAGYNEPAANATRKAVKEFVRTVFKLE